MLNLWKTNSIYQNDVIEPLINLAPPTATTAPKEVVDDVTSPIEQPSSTQAVPEEGRGEDRDGQGDQDGRDQVLAQDQIDSLLHQQQKQLETLIGAGAGQPMISLLLNKAQQLQELQVMQKKLVSDGMQPNSNTQSPVPVPNTGDSGKSATAKLSEFSKVREVLLIKGAECSD